MPKERISPVWHILRMRRLDLEKRQANSSQETQRNGSAIHGGVVTLFFIYPFPVAFFHDSEAFGALVREAFLWGFGHMRAIDTTDQCFFCTRASACRLCSFSMESASSLAPGMFKVSRAVLVLIMPSFLRIGTSFCMAICEIGMRLASST